MKCPVCKEVNLSMTERRGIEIDYCPQCRGIWLDRGELDRMLAEADRAAPEYERGREDYREPKKGYREPKYGHHKPKRKSFLREMLDFD